MNWIKFTIWLTGIYLTYYGFLILWDYLRSGRVKSTEEKNELTFAEHEEPVRLQSGNNNANPARFGSPVVSSGGVLIKQLLSLAQQDAVEFTRAVSFS